MPLHFPQDTPPSIFSHLHRPPPSLHSRNSNLYPLYPMYLSLLIKFPLRHAQSHNVLFVHSILFVYSKYGTTVREIPYTDMILFRRTPLAVSQSTHGFFSPYTYFSNFVDQFVLFFSLKIKKKWSTKEKIFQNRTWDHPLHRYEIRTKILLKMMLFRPNPTTP